MEKRLLLAILGVLVVVAVLTSCEQIGTRQDEITLGETYTHEEETTSNEEIIINGAYLESLDAMQYGRTESAGILVHHTQDVDYRRKEYYDDTIESKISFSLNEQVCELVYQGSQQGPLKNDSVDEYRGELGGKKLKVWLNRDTGECVKLVWDPTVPETEGEMISPEQQYEIAYAFFCAHVKDPEAYQMVFNSGEGIRTVQFVRYIGEFPTYERVGVAVDSVGNVIRYFFENVGDLRGVQPVPEAIIEKVNDKLDSRAKSIYGDLEEGYSYTYKTEIDRLVRLDDGSLALECHISANVTDREGNLISDGAWFVIPITEPTQ